MRQPQNQHRQIMLDELEPEQRVIDSAGYEAVEHFITKFLRAIQKLKEIHKPS